MYTIEGKNIKDRLLDGRTGFFSEKKEAVKYCSLLKSYIYEVFDKPVESEEEQEYRESIGKREPIRNLVGWAVPK